MVVCSLGFAVGDCGGASSFDGGCCWLAGFLNFRQSVLSNNLPDQNPFGVRLLLRSAPIDQKPKSGSQALLLKTVALFRSKG